MTTEHDALTAADLEDLALDLEEFCEQRPRGQQAILKTLLANAADHREEVKGGYSSGDERSVGGVHADPNLLNVDTRTTAPSPQVFYVMGVPVFEY